MDGDGPATPPRPRSSPSTRTTVGVLVAMAVVLIVAGLGIARVRNAQETLRRAAALVTTSTTAPPGTPGPAAAPPSDLSPAQQKAVDDVKAQVSAIRGLPWKANLPVKFVSRAELARRIKSLNAEEVVKHGDQRRVDESVLKLLQLIPRDLDYTKAVDDLLAGGVLGFYDDEAKELFVGGDGDGPPDAPTRSVLAHELTHALTDQHFQFGTRTKALDDANRTEESAAFTALIEGDAELVRSMWEEKNLTPSERLQAAVGGSADGGAYDKAPPYLLDSLLFPYQDGVSFVRSRYKAGGFAEVDNAYRSPPTSTEQILHPDLYAPGQGWMPPPLPDLAAATGCGKVDNGTLGEFDMAELLARQLNTSDSHTAATGWNADAYGVVRCGTELGLADRWQADNDAEAGRLADALGRWSKGWSGSSRAPDADGRFAGPKGAGRVQRSAGGRVELVLAGDLATADRLARALTSG
jgi:hypothetical protein